jgi:hypothetical protein
LHLSVWKSHRYLTQQLLDMGADPDLRNSFGESFDGVTKAAEAARQRRKDIYVRKMEQQNMEQQDIISV